MLALEMETHTIFHKQHPVAPLLLDQWEHFTQIKLLWLVRLLQLEMLRVIIQVVVQLLRVHFLTAQLVYSLEKLRLQVKLHGVQEQLQPSMTTGISTLTSYWQPLTKIRCNQELQDRLSIAMSNLSICQLQWTRWQQTIRMLWHSQVSTAWQNALISLTSLQPRELLRLNLRTQPLRSSNCTTLSGLLQRWSSFQLLVPLQVLWAPTQLIHSQCHSSLSTQLEQLDLVIYLIPTMEVNWTTCHQTLFQAVLAQWHTTPTHQVHSNWLKLRLSTPATYSSRSHKPIKKLQPTMLC